MQTRGTRRPAGHSTLGGMEKIGTIDISNIELRDMEDLTSFEMKSTKLDFNMACK